MKRKVHGSEVQQKQGYQPELKGGLWTGKYIESDETFAKRITKESNEVSISDFVILILAMVVLPLNICYWLGTISNINDYSAASIIGSAIVYSVIVQQLVFKKFKVK